MIAHIAAILTGLPAIPISASAMIAEMNERVLSEVHQHVQIASECYQEGKWNESIAHSEAILLLGTSHYRVDFGDASKSDQTKFEKAVNAATKLWENALDQQVDFEPSEEPEITIKFERQVQSTGRQIGGHVQWSRTIEPTSAGEYIPKLTATIWVRTLQPDGRPMKLDHLKHVISHELGHIIGLNDSSKVGDIMGPLDLNRPAKQLAKNEVEAIVRVRNQALNWRKACLLSALQELEGYNLPRATR